MDNAKVQVVIVIIALHRNHFQLILFGVSNVPAAKLI